MNTKKMSHLLSIQQDVSWLSLLIDDELAQLEAVVPDCRRPELFDRLVLCQSVISDLEKLLSKVI